MTDIDAADLHRARDADVAAIVALMNRAYRGEGADAGWNSEAGYMDGERTNEALLRQELAARPDAFLLLWRPATDIAGCVWLEDMRNGVWYLGSLTVDPRLQAGGVGRRLLAAAEHWAQARGAGEIRMTVVNVRDALIAWYVRRGYRLTGETEPYPYEDGRFGTPRRDDLQFVVLGKRLGKV